MKYNPFLVNEKAYALATIKEKVAQLRASGQTVIDLTLGDPEDLSCPVVRTGIKDFIDQNPNSSYPKSIGSDTYRAAVCTWAKREYDLDIDPNLNVLSCNGTKEAVCSLALAFDWSDNKKILFPSLSYPVYKSSAQLYGIDFVELPINRANGFLPDLDQITENDWSNCGIFWLNSPHNPTSVIATKDYCERLLEKAEKYGFLIASDEAYSSIFFEERPFSFLELQSENYLVFSSLSKRNNMTGYRTGAMITLNVELRNMLAKMRAPMGMGMSNIIAAGAEKAWLDTDHAVENRNIAKKKSMLLKQALEDIGCEVVGGDATFYLWFSHPKCSSSEALWEKFVEQGLVLTPGSAFGPNGEGFIRLAFACTLELCEQVAEKIKAINFG